MGVWPPARCVPQRGNTSFPSVFAHCWSCCLKHLFKASGKFPTCFKMSWSGVPGLHIQRSSGAGRLLELFTGIFYSTATPNVNGTEWLRVSANTSGSIWVLIHLYRLLLPWEGGFKQCAGSRLTWESWALCWLTLERMLLGLKVFYSQGCLDAQAEWSGLTSDATSHSQSDSILYQNWSVKPPHPRILLSTTMDSDVQPEHSAEAQRCAGKGLALAAL